VLTRAEIEQAQARAAGRLPKSGIVLTAAEEREIEVADFGLSELAQTGLEVVVYVNTTRVCAKELVLFPGHQIGRADRRRRWLAAPRRSSAPASS
jgi:hypothetical protein